MNFQISFKPQECCKHRPEFNLCSSSNFSIQHVFGTDQLPEMFVE